MNPEEALPGLETLPEPRFEFLFGMALEVEKPDRIGPTHVGDRRVVGVSGGEFEGPRLKGRVLPGGSDWIVVRRDGVLIQDVRIVLQTDDGHDILMSYRGMRHGPEDVIERVNNGEDPGGLGDPTVSEQERCLDRCTDGYDRCLRKGAAARPDPTALDGRLQCATDYSECAQACLD